MPNLHVFQHHPAEEPGVIAGWAAARGYAITTTRPARGGAFPAPADVDFLVLMGGPMNVYQDRDFPWLRAEREFIAAHVATGKPAVGICLGAQFLADALGGRVTQNPAVEIGWFPVEFTAEARARFPSLPAALDVVHWHGDTFETPRAALPLAASAACANQGFLHDGRVLALQFHPEMTPAIVAALAADEGSWPTGPFVQAADEILARPAAAYSAANALLLRLLDEIFPAA